MRLEAFVEQLKALNRQFEPVFMQVAVWDYKRFLEQFFALDQPLDALGGGGLNVLHKEPGLWADYALRRGIAHMELAETGDRRWDMSMGLRWVMTAHAMGSPDAPYVIAQVLRLPWASQLLAAPRIPETERYTSDYGTQDVLLHMQAVMSRWELDRQRTIGGATARDVQPRIDIAQRRAKVLQYAATLPVPKPALAAAPAAAPPATPAPLSASAAAELARLRSSLAAYMPPPAPAAAKSPAEAAYLRGSASLDRRDVAAAIRDLQEAVRLQPDNVEYLTRLAAAYRRVDDGVAATAMYERALSLKRDDPYLYLGLAEALASSGRKDEALRSADKAVALRPDSSSVRFERDAIARRVQEAPMSEARPAVATSPPVVRSMPASEVKAAPASAAEAAYRKGMAHGAKREFAAAIPYLQEAVELEPANAEYLQRLAQAYRLSGDPSTAVNVYQKAISLSPSNAGLHIGLAAALASVGRTEEALKSADNALAISPDNPALVRQRGELAKRLQEAPK